MAGPNVGRIEITVDANTGKLKAQVVRAAKAAGEAGGEAIEEGLSDVDGRELLARLRAIREQAQAAMAGIAVDIDLEADVQSDLRRIAAQVRATQIQLFLNPEIDDPALQALLNRLRVQLAEAVKAEVNLELTADEVGKLIEEAEAALEFADLTVQTQLELSERSKADFKADLKRALIEAELEADAIDVAFNIEMRSALAIAEAEAVAEEIESIETKMQADLETKQVILSYFGVKETIEADHIRAQLELDFQRAQTLAAKAEMERIMGTLGIPLDVELASEEAELAAFRQRQEHDTINIPVDVNTSSLDSAGGGLSTRWKAILGGIVVLAEPAAVAIQGLLGGAVSVLSSGFSALGASAGIAGPAVAGVGASVATLTIGLQGMGDALSGDAAALDRLAPSARQFADAFIELGPTLDRIRTDVQGELFAGLTDEFDRLTKTALPAVANGLRGLAGSFNDFFGDIANAATQIDFEGIFAGLRPAVESILDAIVELFRSIEPFLDAAAPAAQALADSFEQGAQSLRRMIQAGAASGGLTDFLMEGVDSLRLWGDLARNVGDALFTLFEAGKASGDSMVGTLSDIVARFDEWMESAAGQDALATFFETSSQLMSDMVPILKGLQGLFKNLVTPAAIARFGRMADSLGDILPVLGSLFELVGRVGILETMLDLFAAIGEAIEPIIPELQKLADAIGEALSDQLDALLPVLPSLAEAFGELALALIPVVQTIAKMNVRILEIFADIAIILAEALELLAEAFQVVGPPMLAFIDTAANVVSKLNPLAAVANLAVWALGGFGSPEITAGADNIVRLAEGATLAEVEIGRLGDESVAAIEHQEGMAAAAALAADQLVNLGDSSIVARDAVDTAAQRARIAADDFGKLNLAADVEDNVRRSVDPLYDMAAAAEEAGDAADVAAGKADKLREAFDKFINPTLDASAAARGMEEAFDNMTTALEGGEEALSKREEAMKTLSDPEATQAQKDHANALLVEADALEASARSMDVKTEAGRNAIAAAEAQVKSILDQAEAQVALTGNTADAAVAMVGWRQQAIDAAIAAGSTEEAARAMVDTMGLTPDEIATRFILSDMDDAQKKVIAYTDENLNNIPDAIDTLINQPGMSQAQIDALLYDSDLDGIEDVVDTDIRQTGMDAAMTDAVTYDSSITAIPETWTTDFTANTTKAMADVNALNTTIKAMDGKVIKIFGSFTPLSTQKSAMGGIAGSGGTLGGEAGPELVRIGQLLGMVSQPAFLPPGTIVSPLTGPGRGRYLDQVLGDVGNLPTGTVIQKQVNLSQSFILTEADPEAVAVQTMNRAASMANV